MTTWNEKDHPREPAGSPHGGWFTDRVVQAARNAAKLNPHKLEFEMQDSQVELQPKMMDNRTYGTILEAAGDIMREQWLWFGTGDSPYGSRSYVMEKVERILDNINYWEANQLLSRKDLGLTDQLKVFWNSRESYDLSSKAGITLMNSLLVRDWPEARRNLLILKKLYQR